ncbi:F-box protein At5g07610-like isoform X2 [Andrographis paniculata]|nr:F-box protein At5g07610-like isoform X2 [Andrographis paniculata]XP_051138136.1 F-box protein At5g07610-like isoform X2 [Andrographis paniculata]XP_051138137.1 F-box protein At5g07610-like isoform X2 [Andrographis paniculata]XP_051138138.1 F-box protein At5g07610-like isoform X2 [Andrographis paniculata]XP_051138140.1 F-box protein At5g07610-like isoform X2 [Andrographis paniculata]XP_051138141.1 F-box protein At5g07610-like isoform X2 [Andrographis paniculata]
MIANNEDLLIEILLWLPPKSLMRFKLVCKQWLSIIASRHFSELHTRQQRDHLSHDNTLRPSLLLRLAESSNYFHIQQSFQGQKWSSYHFSPTLSRPIVRGFSNGLFLLQCQNGEHPLEECHVYNPVTKESRVISLNNSDQSRCVVGLNLAFDPLKSPHYKIVCVRTTRRRSSLLWRSWWRRCQIEVYESDTGAWKLHEETILAPSNTHFHQGIYWNGGIHWNKIFFDLHGNCVRKHPEVLIPDDPRTVKFCDYVESNDYLHYVVYLPEEKSVMVFELLSDYSSWTLKYHINLDIFSRPLSVLSMIRRESEEDDMLILHKPGMIMAYRFRDKSVEVIVNFEDEEFYKEQCIQFFSQCTIQYTETLAPP